jgi:hypothetical protein
VTGAAISYASNNTSVATVNAGNGTITGVGAGSATITATATATGVSATQVVSVIGHPSGVLVGTIAGRVGGLAIVNNTAYVAHPFANELAFVDLPTASTVTSLSFVDQQPFDVAASRTGTGPIVVATNGSSGSYLRFVSPTTRLQLDSLPLSGAPVKVAINAAGTRAFVAMNTFQIAIVDVSSRTVASEIPLGGTVVAMKVSAGDSLLYIATRLGAVFEIRMSTGAIRRQIQGSPNGVTDIDVSPDGRTLFVADGTPIVNVLPLFTGGLSRTVDFGAAVIGVAMTPDAAELWASLPGEVVAAPFENGDFNPNFVAKRYALAGSSPSKIFFNQFGNFVAIIDQTNQLIIRR